MQQTNHLETLIHLYEGPFLLNNKKGNISSKVPFDIKKGSVPILLSMPHSVVHLRNHKLKEADDYTGSIGLIVQSLTNCYSLYSTRLSEEDPNYVKDGLYKKELVQLIKRHNIAAVIDIHGASLKREFDIDLGTLHGKSIKHAYVENIREIFNRNNIKDVRENDTFPATHTGTITSYVYTYTGIPCIQIEINGKYRNPLADMENIRSIIHSLVDIVDYLSVEIVV
ncbi:N-formylglutamate amidohydrolase [Alkalihalobacillus sp. TS-13]|uniref:N-formylglutamate amidohydrolase n=1 Tax=Alkalihalobacillus sp. TS-13 TaxID=2842455 RepID=UPI001C88D01D|nr:N-formylglutamate amidohydrolase [Alkalihalobacillus sp. TS-13]